MATEINLTSIYIANLMAVVLVGIMIAGKHRQIINNRIENTCINILVMTVFMACIIDPLSFTFDGKAGLCAWFFAYVGNGLLFCLNMVVGPAWSTLIIHHVRGTIYKHEKIMIVILSTIGFLLMVVNLFTPIIYHVDENNVYHRDSLYWYFLVMEVFFLIYGSVAYCV